MLSAEPSKEKAISLLLLTRELGVLRVYAEGVRSSTSKMRLHILRYACVTVAMVRGKRNWRLTGISVNHSYGQLFKDDTTAKVAARVMQLCGRLVPEELSGYGTLYDDVIAGLHGLESLNHHSIEVLVVLRLLSHLGYLKDDEQLTHLLCRDCEFTVLAAEAKKVQTYAIVVINEALALSQL